MEVSNTLEAKSKTAFQNFWAIGQSHHIWSWVPGSEQNKPQGNQEHILLS